MMGLCKWRSNAWKARGWRRLLIWCVVEEKMGRRFQGFDLIPFILMVARRTFNWLVNMTKNRNGCASNETKCCDTA
jgi:hypothetical protein